MSLPRTLVNNFEVWGNQQMDLTTGDTTEWDVGVSQWTDDEAENRGIVDGVCHALSPAVAAQGNTWQDRDCADAGAMFRGVLTRAGAWAAGGFATAVVPCIGFTVGWGPCVVGAATGGFVWGIIYEGYDRVRRAARVAGRSSVGPPAPERLPRIHRRP